MSAGTTPSSGGAGPGIATDNTGGSWGRVQAVKLLIGDEGDVDGPVGPSQSVPVAWGVPGNVTNATVSASVTSVQLIAANVLRRGLIIRNTDPTGNLYITRGGAATVANSPIVLEPGGVLYDVPSSYRGAVYGIWDAINGGKAVVEETYD